MIFCFMCLAPVLSWRGGMFSIWSPRRQRSPTPLSPGGTSTPQDTMFTTGTLHQRAPLCYCVRLILKPSKVMAIKNMSYAFLISADTVVYGVLGCCKPSFAGGYPKKLKLRCVFFTFCEVWLCVRSVCIKETSAHFWSSTNITPTYTHAHTYTHTTTHTPPLTNRKQVFYDSGDRWSCPERSVIVIL